MTEEGEGGAINKLRTVMEEIEVGDYKMDKGELEEKEGDNAEAEDGGWG